MSTNRPADADGRLQSSIYAEQAATAAGCPKVGLWSIIDGTPYQSLGQITDLAIETPHLYKHDTDTAIAAKAEARRQQQGFVEEQHATALRVLDSHLPRPSSARNPNPVKSRSHAEHLKSKAIDADDAWLAQLDPAVQSLLIRKHPLHLTTLDRAEARFPVAALAASNERQVRCRSRTQRYSSSDALALSQDARSWGSLSPSPSAPHGNIHPHTDDADQCSAQKFCRDSQAAVSAEGAAFMQELGGAHIQHPSPPDSPLPCSPAADLVAAPTFSQHDFAVLVPVTKSAADRQPYQHRQVTPVNASIAATKELKAPLPRNVSMTMRARTREDPALASYLSAHARSRTDRLTPLKHGMRSATARKVYIPASTDKPQDAETSGQDSKLRASQNSTSLVPAMPEAPVFEDIVKPPRQAAGHVTPALRCQRSWLLRRQQQRHSLQGSLWERAQHRSHAAAHPPLAAACTHILLQELEHSSGHRPAYCVQGHAPKSIGQEAEQMLQGQEERPPVELLCLELTVARREEVNKVAHFYEALCTLAQKGKAVDLLSMTLLLQVKHGLEEGIGLKPQLVIRSLRGVTHVAAETGMLQQCAARLLPLLTFMRKSVGMSEGLFVHHVRYLGAMQLLFTTQQLEAITQMGKAAAPTGSSHEKKKSRWPSMANLHNTTGLRSAGHSTVVRAASAFFDTRQLQQHPSESLQQDVSPATNTSNLVHSGTLFKALPRLA